MQPIARTSVADSSAHHQLSTALHQLDPADRILLTLFYVERLDLEGIARVLGEEENEVAARFYLAHAAVGMAEPLSDARLQLQVA